LSANSLGAYRRFRHLVALSIDPLPPVPGLMAANVTNLERETMRGDDRRDRFEGARDIRGEHFGLSGRGDGRGILVPVFPRAADFGHDEAERGGVVGLQHDPSAVFDQAGGASRMERVREGEKFGLVGIRGRGLQRARP